MEILFWFYKDIDVCINRLELTKKHNPNKKIYGLFGGSIEQEGEFREALCQYLDNFYTHPSTDSDWKWINGDLMIVDWYKDCGADLEWRSIAVVQWDMLIFDSLDNIFSDIKDDQIFLSGNKILDKETESKWHWTKPEGNEHSNFDEYKKLINETSLSNNTIYSCLFIFQIFPRVFFEKYIKLGDIATGMLEYKIPTYAKILGIEFYKKDIGVKWFAKGDQPLNARKKEITQEYINTELEKNNGWRMFHPYFKKWEN